MKPSILFLATSLLLTSAFGYTQESANIIPRPAQMKVSPQANFTVDEYTALFCEHPAFDDKAEQLRRTLNQMTDLTFSAYEEKTNVIRIIYDASLSQYGEEAYSLTIKDNIIKIGATTPKGVFYAGQSLLQLFPKDIFKPGFKKHQTWNLPSGIQIIDYPRFAWRSLLIDESRHFLGMAALKEIIDQMALVKMNILHFHMADDAGWRVEIKRYPKLTSIGSKRKDSETGTWGSGKRSGKAHQGFYTQAQIRELVKYAADRNITIVPEVAMPGHASCIIAAYPELGTDKKPIETPVTFGKKLSVLDPTSEETYEFIENIIEEICELFPSPIIHIGGDEVLFKQWNESLAVQQLAKEKKFNNTNTDVQVYFTNKIAKIIEAKGRRVMGWNEIMGKDLHGQNVESSKEKLNPKTIVHFWKGATNLANQAITSGHDVVNSNHIFTYLDYSYGSIPLTKSYHFDPIFDNLPQQSVSKVIGSGCQAWGEWIPNRERLHFQVFPRLCAYAETFWTPKEEKDFRDFNQRLQVHAQRLSHMGILYNQDAIKQQIDLSHKDLFNHPKLGFWTPTTCQVKRILLPATTYLKAAKEIKIFFLYNKGANGLDIESVRLLKNGKEIAIDQHIGFSGVAQRHIIYHLKNLPAFDPQAIYEIEAIVKGSGGNDSYGTIYLEN